MAAERMCVIGVDSSSESETAFDFYVRHMHQSNFKLVLTHVVEPRVVSSNQLSVTAAAARDRATTEEKQLVKELQDKYEDKMRSNGIRGRINVVYYSTQVGKVLSQVASDCKAVYIVVGYKEPSNGKAPKASHCVTYLLNKAPCPVVVARKKIDPALVLEDPKRRGSRAMMADGVVTSDRLTELQMDARPRRGSCPSIPSTMAGTGVAALLAGAGLQAAVTASTSGTSVTSDLVGDRLRRHSSITWTSANARKAFRRLSLKPDDPESVPLQATSRRISKDS